MTLVGVPVLVTGAGGFIGSHLVRRLVSEGADVHGWVRPTTDRWRLAEVASRFTVHTVDVSAADEVLGACLRLRPAICFHSAAYGLGAGQQNWQEAVQTNVAGTAVLLDALRQSGCGRLVYLTTCYEYASQPSALVERDPLSPRSVYSATKAAATLVVRAWADHAALPTVIARLFSVYGPAEDAHKVLPYTITTLLNQGVAQLSSCDVVRDYTYIDDMAEGVVRCAQAPVTAGATTINLGSGRPVRLRDVIELIARQLNGRVQFGKRPPRPGDAASLWADIEKAKALLQWEPRLSLDEGVRRTIEWFRAPVAGTRGSRG